jgi:ribosomal-protein-alanine N-acetyltransferase
MPVRPARPADHPALSRLQSHLDDPSPSLLAAAGVTTVLVSADGIRPVGYLLAVDSEREGRIAELVVAPDRRREGRASALLSAYLRRRPPGTRVALTVSPDNGAARSLYEARGFDPAGRLPGFFASGDAIVYEKTA